MITVLFLNYSFHFVWSAVSHTVRGKLCYSPTPTFISKFVHPASSSFAGSVHSISVPRDKGNPFAMNYPIFE